MKNILKILSLAILGWFIASCEENNPFPGGGQITPPEVLFEVTDGNGPVANATITIFRNNANYRLHQSAITQLSTDANGLVTLDLEGYEPGVLFFSVQSNAQRNWIGIINTPALTITAGTTLVRVELAELPEVELSGPEEMTSGQTVTFSIPNWPGIKSWSIVEGPGSLMNASTSSVSFVTEKSPEPSSAVIRVEYTYNGFEPGFFEVEVSIAAFCDYVPSSWAGNYSTNEPGYGNYPNTLTQDDENPNKFWIDNFWNYGGEAYYIFSENSEIVTLPKQIIEMGGDEYEIEGVGYYDQCNNVFVVDYKVFEGGEEVDNNTHTFTKL
jgi:hypothetical protein